MISNEYAIIFNGVTEILNEMEILTRKLKMYQQLAEESFISSGTYSEKMTEKQEVKKAVF